VRFALGAMHRQAPFVFRDLVGGGWFLQRS